MLCFSEEWMQLDRSTADSLSIEHISIGSSQPMAVGAILLASITRLPPRDSTPTSACTPGVGSWDNYLEEISLLFTQVLHKGSMAIVKQLGPPRILP